MKISVIVHPNAKQPRVEKDLLEVLHVYVSQPPLEGKANAAVINTLAEHLKVKRNQILLISGEKTKYKVFQINSAFLTNSS